MKMIDSEDEEEEEIYERPLHHNQAQASNTHNENYESESDHHITKPVQTVPQRVPQAPRNKHWEIPPIECNEPDDGVFYAQLGPTGGKQGYPAITG